MPRSVEGQWAMSRGLGFRVSLLKTLTCLLGLGPRALWV